MHSDRVGFLGAAQPVGIDAVRRLSALSDQLPKGPFLNCRVLLKCDYFPRPRFRDSAHPEVQARASCG
jgi:hypothetical protein